MKDIDFDELDRAVSSVLGSSFTDNKKTDSPNPTSVDSSRPTPQPKTVEPQQSSAVSASQPAIQPVVSRRPKPGRFMDMVPSAHSKRPRQDPAVSRQGQSFEPLNSEVALAPGSDSHMDVTADVSTEPKPNELNTSSVTSASQAGTLPDPLDFNGPNSVGSSLGGDESDTGPAQYPVDTEAEKGSVGSYSANFENEDKASLSREGDELANADEALVDQVETLPPIDTPFVSDSNVKKRPLGAFSVDEDGGQAIEYDAAPEDISAETEIGSVHDINAAMAKALAGDSYSPDEQEPIRAEQRTADPGPVVDSSANDIHTRRDAQVAPEVEDLPEELQGDLVAIESRQVEPSGAVAPALSGSIQQQYTQKPAVQSEEEVPVFDTANYHQPLRETTQRGGGWRTLAAILVLVLAGAGVGAAVYFLDPFGLR